MSGFFVQARQLDTWLSQYTFNLFVWTDWDECKVSLLGSATPLHYRGEYLVVCTRHQIKDIDPENVSMLTDDGVLAITSSGYSAPDVASGEMEYDLQDIAVFHFTQPCEAHPELKKWFFPFSAVPPICAADDIVFVTNYGFPSADQVYELYENNHIGSRRRSTILGPHSDPSDPTLLHLKPIAPLSYDPDGLSGGPNFVVQKKGAAFSAYFAGVTVRAGREDFYIVRSGYIKGLLDAAIDARA